MISLRPLLSALILALGTAVHAGVPTGSIDAFIDSEMAESSIPGVAYAAVDGGEIVSVGVRGVADNSSGRQLTLDTPFLIGSISKSFTALAVMQLVETGAVDLDAPVSDYLPPYESRPAGAMTIRQALSHTTGFSTLQGNTTHGQVTDGDDELAQRVEGLAGLTPDHAPGERWEYSNANYEVLGRVIEVVTGESFQTYIESKILQPIGMEHSFVSDGAVHDSMATGHRPWFGTHRPLQVNSTARGTAPQGGIVATAGDLALYMQTMMNGQDDVLSASGKLAMMRSAGPASPFYGFGWFVDTETGNVWHSGLSPGFETLATMVPSQQKGVVVLVNANGGIGFGETAQLRNGITARALQLDYDGEGSRWPQRALFVSVVLMPVLYLVSMVWAWRSRAAIRAKSGIVGMFSLWFPLLTTAGAAWVMTWLVPNALASPMPTLLAFQPDLALALISAAALGVSWAVFRLVVGYTGSGAEVRPGGRPGAAGEDVRAG